MAGASRDYTARLDPKLFHASTFVTGSGLRLESVLLTHDSNPNRYWILFCPPAGASTQVRRIQGQLHQLWDFGYNVFAFDYRGFGDNAGMPTEEGLYADATAAFEHLTQGEGVSASQVILAGRSLGSSVAVDLATRVDAAGLLLFSPIDSVPSVGARLYPWAPVRWLARYSFNNRVKAGRISRPVILVYGSGDGFMPSGEARLLFQAFRGPRVMLETSGGHHHSGFIEPVQLWRALLEFWPVEQPSKVM
jgi:pimeloyl-ACP methyl ester carboxylesterase